MENVEVKNKEEKKERKNNYVVLIIVGALISLLLIGGAYYFIFVKDDNDNASIEWIDRQGSAKDLSVSINDNKITYKCVAYNCELLESGKNFILVNDNGYYIYDITKKLSLKLDITNIGDSRVDIIEKNSDILGIFYSNTNYNHYYYSIGETKNYSLEYEWANGMIYEMVKDGYYQAYDGDDMIIDYRNNKKMFSLIGGCSGISAQYGNLTNSSYYYIYDTECGDGKRRVHIYTNEFKEVGNSTIGYSFYNFGMDDKENYIVSTDLKSINVIDENGTIVSTKKYMNVVDGMSGYFIVNNESKIQLVKYDGSLIKDFTETFKGKKLDNLIGGDTPFSTMATLHYNENNEPIIQFTLAYSDDVVDGGWPLDAKIINYTIIYNVDSNLALIKENTN